MPVSLGVRGRRIIVAGSAIGTGDYKICQTELPPGLTDLQTLMAQYEWREEKLVLKDFSQWANPSELKIAIVSLFGDNCGIATYTEYLVDAMRTQVKELRVFAATPIQGSEIRQPSIPVHLEKIWDRYANKYAHLMTSLEQYDPDVVFVQHEYGLFSDGALWNSLIGQLNAKFRTVVVLHAVYDHDDKLIMEAPCREVIVHSEGAKRLLLAKGLSFRKLSVVPHGCLPTDDKPLRFQCTSRPYIFQFGFGFEYKGWSRVLEIMERLVPKFPDLQYIGCMNVSSQRAEWHREYYEDLLSRAEAAGLADHFTLHLGYQPENVLRAYMKQARVCLLPYWNHSEWRVQGASGAARLALASGTPCVMGDVPFFEEFKGYIPVLSDVDDYVHTLSRVLTDSAFASEVASGANRFISERLWSTCAAQYLSTLKNPDEGI